ncbi:hypothetical protein HPB50_018475 [Hyalomma asiaticum]|uniref:Uncharacterized protein n=1 Tax=Hyalomma asiaticum TaxID=266040 RepID=A0ACB7TR65_HYAAI|nr:hypothetical protein HPB50_018475 [Hyalomma asiaticum]
MRGRRGFSLLSSGPFKGRAFPRVLERRGRPAADLACAKTGHHHGPSCALTVIEFDPPRSPAVLLNANEPYEWHLIHCQAFSMRSHQKETVERVCFFSAPFRETYFFSARGMYGTLGAVNTVIEPPECILALEVRPELLSLDLKSVGELPTGAVKYFNSPKEGEAHYPAVL